MNRRKFLTSSLKTFGASAVLSNLYASDFDKFIDKKPLKIGYLPITDHLIMIACKFNPLIEPLKFSNWTDISEALRANKLDGAFLLAPLGMALKASGADIKVVLLAHKDGSALVVRDGITAPKELENKKIAIPSRFSSHYFMLDKFISSLDIDIKLIDMAPPEMPSALKIGQIDGYIVAEPFGQIGINLGAKVLMYSKEISPNHICCTLNLQNKILDDEKTLSIIQSFKKAANLITSDIDLAVNLGQEVLGQSGVLIEQVLLSNIASYSDLSLSASPFFELKEFLLQKKLGGKILNHLNIDEYLLNLV